MSRAVILLRDGRAYRRDQFSAGLRAAGYDVCARPIRDPKPGDVLMIWNRSRSMEPIAQQFERAGARVMIAENGYYQVGREKYFALSVGYHNGAGITPTGDTPRFDIDMQPWREAGRHVLILPQRGIGSPGVAMPMRWLTEVQERVRKLTKRPVIVRRHPGMRPTKTTLEQDLADAWCAVTWGSGAAIKALVAGVPVFHAFPNWVGRWASKPIGPIEEPYRGDRRELALAITWGQWSGAEIASGEAIRAVLA